MDIPDILKGTPHLPLVEKMLSDEAIELANGFYQTSLDASLFKKSQTFVNADGRLSLELIDKTNHEVVLTFVNKAAQFVVDEETSSGVEWLGDPIQVEKFSELNFLDAVGVGNTYPIVGTDNQVSWQLAQLLNQKQFLGHWSAGTMGSLSAAGITLVYKGSGKDAPEEYNITAKKVAIIRINHGKQKGLVCLRT